MLGIPKRHDKYDTSPSTSCVKNDILLNMSKCLSWVNKTKNKSIDRDITCFTKNLFYI